MPLMITIIGGGVFGLTIGWYLARAGQPVTVFERGQVGHGATWVAAGMLMPWRLSNSFDVNLFQLQRTSHALWPEFAQTLMAHTNLTFDYQTDGRYFVALDEKAQRRFQKQYDYHQAQGFPLQWLTGDELRQREPHLGSKIVAGMASPWGYRVDSRRLIAALRVAFLQAGGILREHTVIQSLLIEADHVCGVKLADETVIQSRTVIVAAGAWSGQIHGLPTALAPLIQPLKGQSLTLHIAEPLLQQTVIGSIYLVPRHPNQLIVGTTVEENAGFDTQPTTSGLLDILTKAQDILPAISRLPLIEHNAALRPTGPNRLPVLGTTHINGLIMASGGHSYGILLSPIVAQALSQFILTGELAAVIAPFCPHPAPLPKGEGV